MGADVSALEAQRRVLFWGDLVRELAGADGTFVQFDDIADLVRPNIEGLANSFLLHVRDSVFPHGVRRVLESDAVGGSEQNELHDSKDEILGISVFSFPLMSLRCYH